MAKKKKTEEVCKDTVDQLEEMCVDRECIPTGIPHPIAPITLEFGREDLNALRDKVNEIISRS